MSFFEGFERGLNRTLDQKREAKQRQEDKDFAAKQLAEEREYSRSDWLFKQAHERAFSLAELQAQRRAGSGSGGGKGGETAAADVEWLYKFVGDTEGGEELLAQVEQDPSIATQLKSKYEGVQEEYRKQGTEFSYSPQMLIENATIYGARDAVQAPEFSDEDLEAAANDPAKFREVMSSLTETSSQQPVVDLSSAPAPNTTLIDKQVDYVDALVFDAAKAAQKGADPVEFARIQSMLDLLGDDSGHAETVALYEEFGPSVAETLKSPAYSSIMTGASNNPRLAPFFRAAGVEAPAGEEPEEGTSTAQEEYVFESEEELRSSGLDLPDGTIVTVDGKKFRIKK